MCPVCLLKDRPGGVGTCDLYEDSSTEESGDGVWTEGLHRSRNLPDAGGGGHLQGPGERMSTRIKTIPQHTVGNRSEAVSSFDCLRLCLDFDPGCD